MCIQTNICHPTTTFSLWGCWRFVNLSIYRYQCFLLPKYFLLCTTYMRESIKHVIKNNFPHLTYLFIVYSTSFSTALIVLVHRQIRECLVYNEVERMWKETALAWTEVLSEGFALGLRKALKNSGELISWRRSEPGTLRLWSRRDNHSRSTLSLQFQILQLPT
jgi:hypothetical protein